MVKVEEPVSRRNSCSCRVDEIASTYEQPQEVVDYYYSKPELLSSVEAVVLEDQVTELVLSKAKVKEEDTCLTKTLLSQTLSQVAEA